MAFSNSLIDLSYCGAFPNPVNGLLFVSEKIFEYTSYTFSKLSLSKLLTTSKALNPACSMAEANLLKPSPAFKASSITLDTLSSNAFVSVITPVFFSSYAFGLIASL